MKQKLKKIIISFFTLTLIIFPFSDFSVSALSEESNFFEIESLQVGKNEDIVMMINLDLIAYENFNFKLESNESIQNIKTDENVELTNESNEEISFDFNKNNSNLNTITFRYKVADFINVGDKITFKATILDNENEDSELLELEYEIEIVEGKLDSDINDKIDNNEYNNDIKNIENVNIDKVMDLNKNTETVTLNTNSNINLTSSSSKSVQTVTYNGSDNNYLSSLSITNYDLNKDFAKDRLTYFTTVESDVTSLEINATAEESSSVISINGNSDLKDGTNKILITVTAENGNTKTYRIYVIKEN